MGLQLFGNLRNTGEEQKEIIPKRTGWQLGDLSLFSLKTLWEV